MLDGWIKLYRSLQDNEFWTCEPFSRGQAWVDLILLANHKDGFFYKRGIKVDVLRGQCGRSELGLSVRWKWSRTKVRKFLKDLEKEQQIKVDKTKVTQIVTILNYNKYQEKEHQTIQQKYNRSTTEVQQKDTNKNDKNVKNDKNKRIYLSDDDGNRVDHMSVKPDWIGEKDYSAFILHRKKKKAAQTVRAVQSALKEIKKSVARGYSVTQCVDEMCNRNWTGFKDAWMKSGTTKEAHNGFSQRDYSKSATRDEDIPAYLR